MTRTLLHRADAYQAILGAARGALLARVDALSPAQLLELLEASFPFISIPELQAGHCRRICMSFDAREEFLLPFRTT